MQSTRYLLFACFLFHFTFQTHTWAKRCKVRNMTTTKPKYYKQLNGILVKCSHLCSSIYLYNQTHRIPNIYYTKHTTAAAKTKKEKKEQQLKHTEHIKLLLLTKSFWPLPQPLSLLQLQDCSFQCGGGGGGVSNRVKGIKSNVLFYTFCE